MMMFGWLGLLQSVFILLSGGGGPRDLLDLVPTDSYWEAKQVEPTGGNMLAQLTPVEEKDPAQLVRQLADRNPDVRDEATQGLIDMGPGVVPALREVRGGGPELRNRIEGIIAEIEQRSTAADIRRLMAIRTLGELGEQAALPELRALLQSPRMFEAEYAAEAIRQITGGPAQAANARMESHAAGDVAAMPAGSWLIGQTTRDATHRQKLDWESTGRLMTAWSGNPDDRRREGIAAVIDFAERVGNIRYDGATFAAEGNMGNGEGGFYVVVRGQYDVQKLQTFFRKAGRDWTTYSQFEEVPVGNVAGFGPVRDADAMLLIPVDEKTLVAMFGQRLKPEQGEALLARLQNGPGAPLNERMAGLLKQADRDVVAWAAGYAPAWMMAEMPVKGAEAIVGSFARTEAGGGALKVQFLGSNPGALRSTMKLLEGQLDMARAAAENEEAPAAVGKMMAATTLAIDDETGEGTLTMNLPPEMMSLKFYADEQEKQAARFRRQIGEMELEAVEVEEGPGE